MFNIFVIDRNDNSVIDRYTAVDEARKDYPETDEFDVQEWTADETAERDAVFA